MKPALQSRLHELYFGGSGAALRFQSWMLLLDVALIAFFIVAPFIERDTAFFILDYAIAAIRLVQVTMRGAKVRFPCPQCGLLRHDPDAIHCKACGARIRIPHDND